MPNPILVVDNIVKKYNDKIVLENVSFSVEENTIYSLLGPNGAGKTTLLSIITGIVLPTSGEVKIYGRDPKDPDTRRIIGYCPQEPAVYEELTGYENLLFYARLYGIDESSAKQRIHELLETFGLKEHSNKLVGKYSGGMKKRLSLAIALLPDPKILILDEPTTGMDPGIRRETWDLILDLKKKGKTIILATHYMEEADILSDKVAIINEGKIIVEGAPEELKKKYGPKSVISIELETPATKEVVEAAKTFSPNIYTEDNILKIPTDEPDELVPKITSLFYEKKIKFRALRITKPTLEDVFLKLTGRRLRG
ncbi:ABC transporter ATP-binding protein [Desulfurococcaceae archaeon MEX13E-LK6-19]|nr:ABC transporter ATP-binding protein [Desulfurococcaceae archaeon MEX13E-LK6-19]